MSTNRNDGESRAARRRGSPRRSAPRPRRRGYVVSHLGHLPHESDCARSGAPRYPALAAAVRTRRRTWRASSRTRRRPSVPWLSVALSPPSPTPSSRTRSTQPPPAVCASAAAPRRRGRRGKACLRRVGHHLVEDQPERHRELDVELHRFELAASRHTSLPLHGVGAQQLPAQRQRVLGEVDRRQALGAVERLVHHRHRAHAVLALLQDLQRRRVVRVGRLEVEQARHHREVVLDAVVDLLEQDLLLAQRVRIVCSAFLRSVMSRIALENRMRPPLRAGSG